MTCLYNISDPRMCSYSDCVTNRSCVYRNYGEFTPLKLVPRESIPLEMRVAVETLNRNIHKTGCSVVVYSSYCSEGPDEMRLAVIHKDDGEVCRHLQPDKVDWHTLMLLLSARFNWGAHQFNQGKLVAVNILAEHFKIIVGAK